MGAGGNARWMRWLRGILALAGMLPLAAWAANVDLSVSAYTWTPDPVVHGGTSTFSVTVTNNDVVTSANSLSLAINLPANVSFTGQTAPTGCTFDLVSTPKTLTCTNATLAAQATWVVNFNGVGDSAGVQTTTATISATGNTDPNSGNDALTKNTTVINGADLAVTKTGPSGCVTGGCNTTAGSTINFTVSVANHGPDPATTFRVTDNLPAAVDFTYQSASGTGWTCGVVGTTLTCDYSGANVASGSTAPDITVTGRVITSAGTITNGASVASTDGATGDPVAGNNGPSQVVVNVAPGTDLRANKTMVSAATGMTSYATGEAVNLTLSATNQGPQDATGVTLTDIVPTDFSIGTLPGGCAAVGQTITCTVGALGNGATSSSFVIPLTVVGAAGTNGTNTANVARTGPAGGSNTPASVNYSIAAPFAHLTLAKTKSPSPVAAGANITNTITVTNSSSSTSAATGTIRVTDALDANETFVSYSGSGWTCSGVEVNATGTLTCDYAGANLARGASLPALTIVTKAAAGWLGTISNTACTGQFAGSPHSPADNSTTGNCQTRSVTGSNRSVDLAMAKSVSPGTLDTSTNSFSYTLTVSNLGTDIAPTATVTDILQAWYSGDAGTTGGSAVITGQGVGESCSFGSTVTCTLKNVTNSSPRTITITVNRPIASGTIANTATVSTPDAIDTDSGNNSASANIIVAPIADVAVTAISSAPNPVKVGVQLTYTTSIKNNGPSTAAGVVLRHRIDPARMSYVAGSASLTGSGGSCSYSISFSGAPYSGEAGIECSGFSLTNGESRQLTFRVIPVYPYPGGVPNNYTSDAYITTTTTESDASTYANNTKSNTVNIAQEAIDLSVTDNDPSYDPVAFGESIVYQVRAQNNGPSQATGFKLTVTPTPPAQGGQSSPYTMSYNAAGSTLPGGATCSQPGGAGTDVVCYLGADQANSVQAPNASATFNLKFDTGPTSNVPASSITYRTTAKVESYETGASPFAGDTLAGNNSVTETTTVLPKTDLHVASKTVSKAVVDLNETFTYTIAVGNRGPSDAAGVRVTDALPAGFVRTTGAIVVTAGSGVTLTTNSCSGPASGANGTVTCDLGPIPADTTGTDTTKQVTIAIPVRAAYQSSGSYSFAFNSDVANTASIAPLPNTSVDVTAGNNTNTVNVQVRKNSIAGTVYADNDIDDAIDTGEGINSVTLTLTGTDSYGYTYGGGGSPTYPALTTTTPSSGNTGTFLFDKLPPGTWTLVETQPANHWDRFETVGSAGGTKPADTCDGTANCRGDATGNTISAIVLPVNTATAATGYIFQEYQRARISGNVYHDANNDGVKDTGEAAINSVAVTLSGTAYNGVDVCTLATCATTTSSGAYSYTNLPPADATTGYTVTETQPGSHLNGRTTAGTATGTSAVAGTATGANSDVIQGIKVYSNGNSINNNFGELLPATLSGYVFIDANSDAVRQGTETTGVTSVTLTLTGTDDLGAGVNTTATTAANGGYSFTGLRPGTYAVNQAVVPGLTHTGAQAGSKGGTIGGSVRSAGTGVIGATLRDITAISVASSDNATGYNFGESGQGLSGFVYIDVNNNGVKDAGEAGIAGVGVTLSGTTSDSRNICVAISPNPCTVTTNASGAYSFVGLPASNGTGYTLTEQSQATAPLTNYADGQEQLGTGLGAPGTAGSDVFTGIVLPVGGYGTSYNFGELGARISGTVYYDANDNGAKDGSEVGIASVTLTLSGTTTSGANVCTLIASCATTTAADGSFAFSGLPASNSGGYTLTETQPGDYANRTNASGTAGGTLASGTVTSAIVLGAGVSATGYLFGEKTGTLTGFVYHDANNDGVKDAGESGIVGVTLTLSGTSASGSTPCDQSPCTVVTTAGGAYTFTGVRNADANKYVITETQPGAYVDGKETAGSQGGSVDNASFTGNAAQNRISAIPFSAASAATGYNFGEVRTAAISGRVYRDIDDDGSRDAGEDLAGVLLTLSGLDDAGVNICATACPTATTGADGTYSLTGLRPSNAAGYTVTETQPTGIDDYAGVSGTQVGTLGAATVGTAALNQITGIVLPSDGAGTNYNFRETASGLSGYVYIDADNDGVKDAGEPGIQGVALRLSGTTSGNADVCSLSHVNCNATTDTNGFFTFGTLPASNGTGYTITETHPAGYLDGKETRGTVNGVVTGGSDTGVYNTDAANNRITGIVVPVGQSGINYLFGERGGTLSGFVYEDTNNNGDKDTGEAGIPAIRVTLSGTLSGGGDVCAVISSCTATTDATGAYSFVVPPGTYRLVERHGDVNIILDASNNPKYEDGKEKAGVAGGTVNNTYFGGQNAYNTIDAIVVDGATLAANAGNIGGYLFGERLRAATTLSLKPPIVSGYVYMDRKHNRARPADGTMEGQGGWTVVLKQNGTSICTVTTDASGFYRFDNLRCPGYEASGLPTGAGFSIHFSHNGNLMPNVAQSGGDKGAGATGQITGITLDAGDDISEQNLPLDPSGVVYDAVTRVPVAGAIVRIDGPPGFDPATHLLGGAAAQVQTTGADGLYQFFLQNAFPTGTYTLTVTTVPSGYLPAPSVMIPACTNGVPLNVAALPTPGLVQQSNVAPPAGTTLHSPTACVGMTSPAATTTQYYFQFVITNGVSAPILNNHIPIDPILPGGAILMTKTTPLLNITRGELVPYTVAALNNAGGALANVNVVDRIPPGFRYRLGSATLNGLPSEPVVNGRELTWRGLGFTTGERKTWKMILVAGAGIGEGEYTNQAWSLNSIVSTVISNVASATVRVVPDPTFDCSDIIGKVFDDRNANGGQDEGEPGLATVRVATARGLLATTDAEGRFHVACASIPQMDRGSNFVMKLDERTLPTGYRLTTENPRDVRVTRGKMVKVNFGATVHRVVRLELAAEAFDGDGVDLAPAWANQAAALPEKLKERPSVLRIAYRLGREAADLGRKRLDALADRMRTLWKESRKEDEARTPLVIETELEGAR